VSGKHVSYLDVKCFPCPIVLGIKKNLLKGQEVTLVSLHTRTQREERRDGLGADLLEIGGRCFLFLREQRKIKGPEQAKQCRGGSGECPPVVLPDTK